MLEFLRNHSRLVAMLLVAVVNSFFVEFDPEAATNFLDQFLSEFGFTIGSALVMLTGYIGEKRLLAIEPNTTLTSAVAVLTVILPLLIPGVDWTSVLQALNIFAAEGLLTFGAVFGVLFNYFADIRVGRPGPDEPTMYGMSDLPRIVAFGKRAQ